MKNRRRIQTIRKAAYVAVIAIAIIAFVSVCVSVIHWQTREQFREDWSGKEARVEWSVLNLWDEPGNGQVITEFYGGKKLYLTGKVKEATVGGNEPDIWVEVSEEQSSKTLGWVYLKGLEVDW